MIPRPSLLLALLFLPGAFWPAVAERFDDINVVPQTIVNGFTRHGYYEHRLLVVNESAKATHEVAIVFPDNSKGAPSSGLRSIARRITVGPGASMTVRLWQPAVVAWNGNYLVLVDGREVGTVPHSRTGGHAQQPVNHTPDGFFRTYLISRSLNTDDWRDLLTKQAGRPYSAEKATGAPNAVGGNLEETWIPAITPPASPPSITLEYEPPLNADRIRIHSYARIPWVLDVSVLSPGDVVLGSVSRATTIPGRTSSEIHFPSTYTNVAKVTMRIINPPATGIPSGIDAVELVGPGARAWAKRATATSELTAGSSTTLPGPPGGGFPGAITPATARRYGLAMPHLSASFDVIRSEIDTTAWTDRWLSYTPFDLILLTAAEFNAMPEPVRAALWNYAECGGVLAFLGHVQPPVPWTATRTNLAPRVSRTTVGFGHCFALNATTLKDLTSAEAQLLHLAASVSAQPWGGLHELNLDTVHYSFPILTDVRIPVRNLTLLLIIFVLLIGPVNVLVLTRLKRRPWLLWTIPAISLATCVVVFLWSLTREGVTPVARVEGLTLLDQKQHRATSVGMAAFYCPFPPRDGLHFSPETELTLLGFTGSQTSLNPSIDWSQDQHLHDGWIAARLPTFFRTRRSELRRERLHLERQSDGALVVLNGLGATIESLRLRSSSGALFSGSDIAPGARSVLRPAPADDQEPFSSLADSLRQLYRSSGFAPSSLAWSTLRTNTLSPGTYLATLSAAPFLEPGLRARSRLTQRQVVVGWLDDASPSP